VGSAIKAIRNRVDQWGSPSHHRQAGRHQILVQCRATPTGEGEGADRPDRATQSDVRRHHTSLTS